MGWEEAREAGSEGARIQARCAWCGLVELEPDLLRVHVGAGEKALFEFSCPSCTRLNLGGIDGTEVPTLLAAGARWSRGKAPFELLEERSGPPIGWDDLLDFHQELAGGEIESWIRDRPRRRLATDRERNAA
jgi:phage FluMu protein Com